MNLRFVIDESSWRFDGLGEDACVENLELVLDVLDAAFEDGFDVAYSEDLFSVPVLTSKTFYELYSDDSEIQIPQEVRERIGSAFARLPRWDELGRDLPPSFDVVVGGGNAETAPSIAWVHAQNSRENGRAISCVAFPGRRSNGVHTVVCGDKHRDVFFVTNEEQYREFFRWIIQIETTSPAGLEEYAPVAFPELYFVSGAFNGIKGMTKPYRELVDELVRHLGALSDHGARIFSGPWQSAAAEFGPFGVDISDESGKTKKNSEAKKQRTREFNGKELVFWWHTKLERDRDRIHLYPDDVPTGGKIVVGIFCQHYVT